ncbi:glycosyltransferase family 4 protein [Gillisia hiemivivida]|uniref:Glycosyltransferase family 4 protein n=1 Tax=Gillisia hiemivivida TaxID=291190 RepID=A0A5C7A4I4_9FLAO|nr:glycosyltransferase family 4 protein [Gillisia hiemivivida]TXD95749.1 glycosyltransferase family 4 protein [Gillisia hiemivivida]
MKLLFLTDNFPPEVNAPANRTYEHCKEWVEKGVDVTVITCNPNFPKGRVYDGYKNKLYQKETIDGIKVIRVWSYITANEGFVKRILDYISFAITSFFAGLFIKTDLIIATSPQFFTAVSGCGLAFFKRKKWVFEVRDLWPESIIAVGAMERNRAIRIFEWLEKKLYQSADHIVVVTDTFKKKIAARGINPDKISVYKNGANLELFKPQAKNTALENELGLKDKFVFAYIGTHGMAHGLSFILNAIKPLEKSHPEFAFLFIGDGAEKKTLVKQAEDLKLQNAVFVDSVSKKQIVDYLSVMDVALVNLKKSDTFKTVIPSKIFEAAAMEKPILLGLEGETKGIIEQYDAGVCFTPEDQDSFFKAVKSITGKEKYQETLEGSKKLVKDFDRSKIAAKMLECLKEVNNK